MIPQHATVMFLLLFGFPRFIRVAHSMTPRDTKYFVLVPFHLSVAAALTKGWVQAAGDSCRMLVDDADVFDDEGPAVRREADHIGRGTTPSRGERSLLTVQALSQRPPTEESRELFTLASD